MLWKYLELRHSVLPVGILCTYSSHVLHLCMLVLMHKGTWQYQSPKKHVLLVN